MRNSLLFLGSFSAISSLGVPGGKIVEKFCPRSCEVQADKCQKYKKFFLK